MTRTRIIRNHLLPNPAQREARIEGQGTADLRLRPYGAPGEGWLDLDWPKYGYEARDGHTRNIILCRKGIEELRDVLNDWLAAHPQTNE